MAAADLRVRFYHTIYVSALHVSVMKRKSMKNEWYRGAHLDAVVTEVEVPEIDQHADEGRDLYPGYGLAVQGQGHD